MQLLFNKELEEGKKVPFDNGLYIALIIVLLRELENFPKDTLLIQLLLVLV